MGCFVWSFSDDVPVLCSQTMKIRVCYVHKCLCLVALHGAIYRLFQEFERQRVPIVFFRNSNSVFHF